MLLTPLISLLSLLLVCPASPSIADGPSTEKIRRILHRALECHGLAGLAVAVVKGNDTLLSEVFGYSDLEKRRAMNHNDTLLLIASLSKAMTSTLISLQKLEDKYRYDVRIPIRSYLTDFELMDEQRTVYTTLHDLLAHRVGVPRYDIIWVTFRKQNPLKWVKDLEYVSQFRTSFSYSNVMYNLAGNILERLSGQSWSELLHEHIFTPLGMTGAQLIGDKGLDTSRLVRSYFNLTEGVQPMPQQVQLSAAYAQPATGVTLPLSDMITWMKFLTTAGVFIDTPVWSTEVTHPIVQALMETARPANAYMWTKINQYLNKSVIDANLFAQQFSSSYGRGWMRQYYRNKLVLLHGGSLFGVRSFLSWFPRQNISVFVTANVVISRNNPNFEDVPMYLNLFLADLALNHTPWLNENNICHFLKSRIDPPPSKSSDLSIEVRLRKLTPLERSLIPGIYENQLFGRLHLRYNRTSRRLEMKTGSLGRLQFLPIVNFNGTGEELKLRFVMRVVGPIWFYTSHLMSLRLESEREAEAKGRILPASALKFVVVMTKCSGRKFAIRSMYLDILEPKVSPRFVRIGKIREADDYTCGGVGAVVDRLVLLLLLLLSMLCGGFRLRLF